MITANSFMKWSRKQNTCSTMVKPEAYKCEDHYSLIITEDYSLVKTLILKCNQILFHLFVSFMSVSWFAFFFSSWVFVVHSVPCRESRILSQWNSNTPGEMGRKSEASRISFSKSNKQTHFAKYYSKSIFSSFYLGYNYHKIHFREFGEWRL